MRREDLCEKYYASIKQEVTEATRYIVFPMRCKSWDCPTCRKVKAKDYKARLNVLNDGRRLWFLTLTYFHSTSPEESWKNYNVAWNRFRTHLVKRIGSVNYVRILESHKNTPYPHLHIILDKNIRPTLLGRMAVAAGFGYQIKNKPITTEGAFHYVTKYLTKEWTNEEAWKHRKTYRCRIISCSRGLLSPVKNSSGWEIIVRGGDRADCIESVECDYRWRTDRHPSVSYAKDDHVVFEVTINWSTNKDQNGIFNTDNWEPDDWVPK